jgi:hypothetical protein
VKTGEIYGIMSGQYGGNCMRQSKVYEWVEKFKGGWASGGSGGAPSERPWNATCDEIKKIDQHIWSNRIINTGSYSTSVCYQFLLVNVTVELRYAKYNV